MNRINCRRKVKVFLPTISINYLPIIDANYVFCREAKILVEVFDKWFSGFVSIFGSMAPISPLHTTTIRQRSRSSITFHSQTLIFHANFSPHNTKHKKEEFPHFHFRLFWSCLSRILVCRDWRCRQKFWRFGVDNNDALVFWLVCCLDHARTDFWHIVINLMMTSF